MNQVKTEIRKFLVLLAGNVTFSSFPPQIKYMLYVVFSTSLREHESKGEEVYLDGRSWSSMPKDPKDKEELLGLDIPRVDSRISVHCTVTPHLFCSDA